MLARQAAAQAGRLGGQTGPAGRPERADAFLADVAGQVAQARGYPDIGALVLARLAQGASLAAISREAGLHKDWLSRHLHRVDPKAAQAARRSQFDRADAGWLAVLPRLGVDDVAICGPGTSTSI